LIADLCCTLHYLFSNLHQAAKTSPIDDVWESIRAVSSCWPLHPHRDPAFKLIFSKDSRQQLRRAIVYSELCLREALRDPSLLSSTKPNSETSTSNNTPFLSMILRSFLDRSRSLLDRAYKWLTWLDSKLATEFDLNLVDAFNCDPLQLPDSLSSLFKMMDHDLHVDEVYRMHSFSYSHLIQVFPDDVHFLPFAYFEKTSTTNDFLLNKLPSHRVLITHGNFSQRRVSWSIDSLDGLIECLRCSSIAIDSPERSLCDCGGLYRSLWKRRARRHLPNWKSILPIFGPNL
jgi:hypothetical protein